MNTTYTLLVNKHSFKKETAKQSLIKLAELLDRSPQSILDDLKSSVEIVIAKEIKMNQAEKIEQFMESFGIRLCKQVILSTSVDHDTTDSCTSDQDEVLFATINQLNIEGATKEKIKIILKHKPIATWWGMDFPGETGEMPNLTNWDAFFFVWLYYFNNNLWKKGLLLLLIQILVFIGMCTPTGVGPDLLLFQLVFGGYISGFAYNDIYRRLVLKQDFWW